MARRHSGEFSGMALGTGVRSEDCAHLFGKSAIKQGLFDDVHVRGGGAPRDLSGRMRGDQYRGRINTSVAQTRYCLKSGDARQTLIDDNARIRLRVSGGQQFLTRTEGRYIVSLSLEGEPERAEKVRVVID